MANLLSGLFRFQMKNWYQVYILQNAIGKRYIGISENPGKRLLQHNSGQSKWTANFRPWHLEWLSRPLNLSAARKLENLLKRQKGGNGLNTIMNDFGS